MDKIEKALARLTSKERSRIARILRMIQERNFVGLGIKKLTGQQTVFRVRSTQYRIIFRMTKERDIFILAIEKRSDNTYGKF